MWEKETWILHKFFIIRVPPQLDDSQTQREWMNLTFNYSWSWLLNLPIHISLSLVVTSKKSWCWRDVSICCLMLIHNEKCKVASMLINLQNNKDLIISCLSFEMNKKNNVFLYISMNTSVVLHYALVCCNK